MIPIVPRAKLAVANHGTVIAAVLVVVGLVAFAGAAWTLANPPSVEVTEQATTQRVGTDVETSTVVTGNTSLWDRGTTLRNKPVYPLGSAPNLTVRVHTTMPTGQQIHVTQELSLVYRASKDGQVFWQADQQLISKEATVQNGELTSSATFDVRQVRSHLNSINEDITGIGRAQAYLRLNVSYRAADFSGSISKTAPMAVLSSGYWVGGSLEGEKAHETPVTREVSESPDHQQAIGLGLLGLFALGGAGGVVYLSGRRLDPGAIEDELSHQRYREWVSVGRLGQFVSAQDVAMDSLKDLVDVAIDSNNRVVHDKQRELYAVVSGDVIYYYDPFHDKPNIEFEPSVEVPVRHDGGKTSAFEWATDEVTEPEVADTSDTESSAEDDFLRGAASAETAPLPVDAVSVTADVTRKGGLTVISYHLSSDAPAPVTADIVDSKVEPLWAVPEFEPDDTMGIEGAASFQASILPEGERIVRYVVRTGASATDDPEELVRSLSNPQVHRVVMEGNLERE